MQAEQTLLPQYGMRASPTLVAFTSMLALPAHELDALLHQELLANPALDQEISSVCPLCRDEERCLPCPLCSPRGRQTSQFDGLEHPSSAWDVVQASDMDQLLTDARVGLPAEEAPIAEYLIGCLDDHGFLDQTLEDVAGQLGVELELVEKVADHVRLAGPAGVACGGVREHMLLQLDELKETGGVVDLARVLVTDFFTELGSGPQHLARRINANRTQTANALEFIRERLWPFPVFDLHRCGRFDCHVVPDLAFVPHAERPSELVVEVLEPARLKVRLNPLYEKPPPGLTPQERTLILLYAQRARLFIKRLRERWETLRRVGEIVLDRQGDYVRGAPSPRPLTRSEIAHELGLHESTVSRATAGRFVLVPSGRVLPLKVFFDPAGETRALLRRLIASEPYPLSDSELAARLTQEGHPVARRTVAKYRDQLHLPPVSVRGPSA